MELSECDQADYISCVNLCHTSQANRSSPTTPFASRTGQVSTVWLKIFMLHSSGLSLRSNCTASQRGGSWRTIRSLGYIWLLFKKALCLSKGLLVRDPLSTIATAGAPILWLLDWTTCHALLDWFGTKGKKGTKTCHPENVKPCLLFIKSTLLGMSPYVPENAQNGSQPRSGNAQSQGRSNRTCNSARPSVITVIIPSLYRHYVLFSAMFIQLFI